MVVPQIIHLNRVFHHQPSILGYLHFTKPTNFQGLCRADCQVQGLVQSAVDGYNVPRWLVVKRAETLGTADFFGDSQF